MAKQKVCAVFDSAMEAYLRPFFVPTTNMAVRSFTDEVNRQAEDNQMYRHPDDYTLHCLGEFDEESGNFTRDGACVLVRAKDIQKESV